MDEELRTVRTHIQEAFNVRNESEGRDYRACRLVDDSHGALSLFANIEPTGSSMPDAQRAEVETGCSNHGSGVDVDKDRLIGPGDRDVQKVPIGGKIDRGQ